MRVGTLRKRVMVQARSVTQDSFGGQSSAWVDVAPAWAEIIPSVGRELVAAQAMRIDAPSTITMRWRSEFADPKALAAMRIVYGTRIFNIHSSANMEERNRYLTLICSEGLNNG